MCRDKIRHEFESWFQKKIDTLPLKLSLVRYDGGLYVSDLTQIAWMSWCESRSALRFNMPDSVNSVDCGDVLYMNDVEIALDEIGVQYE